MFRTPASIAVGAFPRITGKRRTFRRLRNTVPSRLQQQQLTFVQHQRNNSCNSSASCDPHTHSRVTSASQIPFLYRLWHLYLEPLIALSGAYHLALHPALYFSYMPASAHYSPASRIVYNQLASAYLAFAVIEALVLRSTDDIRVWKTVMWALLVCDAGHAYASWVEMGTRGFWCAWEWGGKDAVTMGLTGGAGGG